MPLFTGDIVGLATGGIGMLRFASGRVRSVDTSGLK